MKTVAFNRRAEEPVSVADVDLIADSALLMPAHPLFVPDFSADWEARLYVAFRVSRLGKSIRPAFAPRYYDATTLALRIIPRGVPATSGLCGILDFALALGRWQSLPQSGSTLRIDCGDTETTLDYNNLRIDDALSAVSQVATLKTGDIIMPLYIPLPDSAITLGTRLTAEVNGEMWLDVKIR